VRAMRPAAVSPRFVAGLAIALVAGIGIGYMDSRPGFDDTGITAVSLVLAAGLAAVVAGRAPWLVAIATGIWVAAFELSSIGSGGPVAALVLAGIGATLGWLVARR
jgi:uncharacterized membrane protein (DUF441 family)